MKLNEKQREAVEAVKSGGNVFITGEAGTGKSVALRAAVGALRRSGRSVVVCAPTGIAAQEVRGATIHSAFRFDLAPKVADELEGLTAPKVLRQADAVVVDEIGMVRRDLMDAIAGTIEAEDGRRAALEEGLDGRRGPLQLVAVGDFSQLPPVVTGRDKRVLADWYGPEAADSGFYAFEADGWRRMSFRAVMLDEPMRQGGDAEFAEMLNRARCGDASCLPYFNRLAHRGAAPSSCVFLVATNRDADATNRKNLDALDGAARSFRGKVDGKFKPGDMRVPELLELKEGARVICMANSKDRGYLNGSTGTVADLDALSSDGLPAVRVLLDGGRAVDVVKATWENAEYRVVERNGRKRLDQEVVGTFEQFPLKLAWAITFHKSQGQTIPRVCVDPGAFAPGQLYVGLSRARSAGGVWLTREIEGRDLIADASVVRFYESLGWRPPAPASGDEAPATSDSDKDDAVVYDSETEAPASEGRGGAPGAVISAAGRPVAEMTAEDVARELHELLGQGGRVWARVYELIDRVRTGGLFRPEFKSFSAWVRAEAEREGVSPGLLWHRKSAGDFYRQWAEGHDDAPALADAEVGEDAVNLIRKIAKRDPGRGDELMSDAVRNGARVSELRAELRRGRGAAGRERPKAPGRPSVTVDEGALTLRCSDREGFERVLAALRAAGVI